MSKIIFELISQEDNIPLKQFDTLNQLINYVEKNNLNKEDFRVEELMDDKCVDSLELEEIFVFINFNRRIPSSLLDI